jgi:hypothetical protein
VTDVTPPGVLRSQRRHGRADREWRSSRCSAIVFADPPGGLLAGDYALVPGKIELTVLLTRTMMPFSSRRDGRRRDGDVELARPLLRPCAGAGRLQRLQHRDDVALLPVPERLGIP